MRSTKALVAWEIIGKLPNVSDSDVLVESGVLTARRTVGLPAVVIVPPTASTCSAIVLSTVWSS